MFDIHNHTLFGVDDGAQTIESAVRLLETASNDGITAIVLTPHYSWRDGFVSDYDKNEKLRQELEVILQEKNIPMRLYLGNELFIHKDLDQMLDSGEVHTMGKTSYVLVEFPMESYSDDYDEILYNIRISGYRIIIAHPERYAYVQRDPNFVYRWTNYEMFLQANADSLKVTRKQKVIDHLIKNRLLHFIASDAHGVYRPPVLSEAYKYIKKTYSKEIADRLFIENPETMIHNIPLGEMPEVPARGLFNTIFGKREQ